MNTDMQANNLATLNPATALPDMPRAQGKPEWGQVWKITRALLVVWAMAVWALLILLPGIDQISNVETATLHLPYMLIGLALVGAVVAAHSLRADRHLLWFLSVLLMLAGWM
ncbi:hypothetical protein [Thiothrix nivea]|uniref:Uncharacterized protein n=1 Tax=Thiothrix nivea (strain ATCC 35100 / DSM 5205 / JP2) TaxID=870187 RepID=A0A656HF88_THINJ|nr:hypothetical protein [Thiothrix nivea]EIJ35023.1 hypothetical protein Thini_2478 [Thiothrix nivea DSM 5205]